MALVSVIMLNICVCVWPVITNGFGICYYVKYLCVCGQSSLMALVSVIMLNICVCTASDH